MKRILFSGIILLFSAAPLFAQSAEQKKATIAYLQKLQNKDGGFRPSAGVEQSSLRATSAALRALKYLGGEAPDRPAAAEFIKKCHDKASGGFADEPGGKPGVAITAIGLMALVELKIPTTPYEAGVVKYLDENVKTFEDVRIAVAGLEAIGKMPPNVKKWQELVEKRSVPPRGAGVARDTGGATVALLRMGIKPASNQAVLKMLAQRPDGAFAREDGPSDLESTYRVMRCYHMLKDKPEDVGRLRAFIGLCRNNDGGYGVAPGEKSGAGPTYFASIILHWLDEK